MVYLLYGDDDFSIKEALQEIKTSLGDREVLGLNTTILDGKAVSLDQMRAICDTVPFLAPVRLVIVENLLSRFDPRGRIGRDAEQWTSFPEYLGGMPETAVLILIDGSLAGGNSMLSQLRSLATIKRFPSLRGAELEKWVRNRVSVLGGTITSGAVRLLCQLVGNNLWVLSSEAEKLVLYSQAETIQEKDVQLVTSQAREMSIFTMVDAVAEGKATQAMHALEELFDNGAAPLYVLFMITRQYRLIIQMQEAQKETKDLNTLGKSVGISSEFAVRKTRDQAGMYDSTQLQEVYSRLLETDIYIKRGQLPPDLALETLIPELCSIVRLARRHN